MRLQWVLASLCSVACSAVSPGLDAGDLEDGGSVDAGFSSDAGALDAGVSDAGVSDAGVSDAGVSDAGKQANCAATFGSSLTNAFGRIDGVVVAVVPPGDPSCALPNSDHVVVQLAFADAGVHRVVVNVQSNGADPRIRMLELSAPLPAPAFQEGWHPGLMLDYPTAFGVHADAGWVARDLPTAARRVYDLIDVGTPISVYGSSSGGTFAASAHLIHRNGNATDGALVVNPLSARPTWVLFAFANQRF